MSENKLSFREHAIRCGIALVAIVVIVFALMAFAGDRPSPCSTMFQDVHSPISRYNVDAWLDFGCGVFPVVNENG